MRFAANSLVFNVEKVKRTNVRVDILESRKVILLLEVLLFYEKKKDELKPVCFIQVIKIQVFPVSAEKEIKFNQLHKICYILSMPG